MIRVMLAAAMVLIPMAVLAGDRALTGAFVYLQRIALPPEATLVIELRDETGNVLSQVRLPTEGAQVPLAFAATVPEGRAAILRGAVEVDGKIEWLSAPVPIDAGEGPTALGDIRLMAFQSLGLADTFRCGDRELALARHGDAARLRTGGRWLDLAAEVTASGAKYGLPGDPGTWFWNKGRGGTASLDGVTLPDCIEVLPDDTPFVAFGNEPGWRLDLAGGRARLQRLGEDDLDHLLPLPETTAEGRRLYLPEPDVVIAIDDRLCRDNMTGMPYPQAVALTLAGQVLAGCGGAVLDFLTAGPLVVTEIDGQPVPDDAEVDMTFSRDGHVGGKSGCNRFAGSFDLNGEGVGFSRIAGTMMACPEPLMATEQQFHQALGRVSRFDVDEGGGLIFLDGDTPVIRARF